MSQPASVCIAAYNEETTIGGLLDHLVGYSPATVSEIMVCVNGCTDNTAGVVKKRQDLDQRIRLLESPRGKPNAWNSLVEHAENDLLVFLDADVLPQAGCIDALIEALQDPSLTIVAGINIPRGNIINECLDRPVYQDFLSGRCYTLRREKTRRKLSQNGFPQMPTDLLGEDLWLQANFTKTEFGIEKRAIVYYSPGTMDDYFKSQARLRIGLEQIRDEYPEQYQQWLDEFREAGSRERLFLRKFVSNPTLAVKALVIISAALRITTRSLYASAIEAHYYVLKAEYLQHGGSYVLGGSGRLNSTKLSTS